MNPQQIQQVARDEALVPTADRVKIGSTNMRIDPTLTQKEETYQVILDILKTSPCYNAFLITANVDLTDKKCQVDVELFCKILHICPRVLGEEFVAPPSKESLLTFRIELGYKGQLNQLSGINDRLRQSRVGILWGMFHKKNVDFTQLIWEDFQYQIDDKQSKIRRREIIPYPRFTKIIINYFLSQHKPIPNRPSSYVKTIKDDGVLNRLKFVSKGEDYQVYGKAILDTMLTDQSKQSETYQTFIALSTCLIPPKKSRGKWSKGSKAAVTPKKKSSITVDDNIIPEPDVALELGKYISRTEAKEQEEARHLHETHEHLVTAKPTRDEDSNESDPESAKRPTGGRRPSGVVFRDTKRASNKKSPDQSQKLKGIDVLTEEEQLAADTMQAIKASRKISRSQPHTGGSSEGAEVPDEAKGSFAAKVDATINWGSEEESDWSDDVKVDEREHKWLTSDKEEEIHNDDDVDDNISIDIEETDEDERTESDNDEYVVDDVDEEMKDGEDAETSKDGEEITNVEKSDAKKTEEAKDDH
ncbi:hypothetical protein Tco_1386049 [Tanacetum coccineum]